MILQQHPYRELLSRLQAPTIDNKSKLTSFKFNFNGPIILSYVHVQRLSKLLLSTPEW